MISLGSFQRRIAPFNSAALFDSSVESFYLPATVAMTFQCLKINERQIVRGNVGNVSVCEDDLTDQNKTIGFEPDFVDLFFSPIQIWH
jgi:hypothetical protein